MTPVLLVVLGLWLAATVLAQLPDRWMRGLPGRVKRGDVLDLVPLWTFFAPRPATTDRCLLYRSRGASGSVGGWRQASAPPERGRGAVLWNPGKRLEKSLGDAVNALLLTSAGASSTSGLLLSAPYLALLAHVVRLPGGGVEAARQFVVVEAPDEDWGRASVLVLSAWHALEERPSAASGSAGADDGPPAGR